MMDTFSCNSYEQNHTPYDHHHDVEIDDHQEESGWTTYLEDFSNQYRTRHEDNQDKSSSSFLDVSPSLVSDAATDAFSGRSFPQKLKFGKARTKKICEDDSLEDTASSPVNSPKVSQCEQIRTPPRKTEDYVSSCFVMGNMKSMCDHQESDEPKMKTIMRKLEERNNNENNNMDLRSRGLCVVPISMLTNFNGRF